MSTGLKDYDEALKFYEKEIKPYRRAIQEGRVVSKLRLLKYTDRISVSQKWREYVQGLKNDKASWVYNIYNSILSRSRRKERLCNISVDDIFDLVISSNGRCQVTDIPFSMNKPQNCRTAPYFPSIDRIDSSKGYCKGNCRLICYAVNMALNQWGDQVLEKISMAFLYKKMRAEFEEKLLFDEFEPQNSQDEARKKFVQVLQGK